MYVNGVNTTVAGATSVAVLPDTGVFRPLFMIGVVMLTIGVATLVVSGVAAARQRMNETR